MAQPRIVRSSLFLVGRPLNRFCLPDGTKVQVRPIGPDDITACSAMLSVCSPKSLYSRYERVIVETPDELAVKLCRPDPRSELTIIAEVAYGTPISIIPFDITAELPHLGVAQLIADPHHEAAEYAVLVADPWQSQGLGSALTDLCLRLAYTWGIRRVVAEFLPDNMRIIRILEERRFDLHRNPQEHVISGQKVLRDENAKPRSRVVR